MAWMSFPSFIFILPQHVERMPNPLFYEGITIYVFTQTSLLLAISIVSSFSLI